MHQKQAMIMLQALEDTSLGRVKDDRNSVRADMLRNMLMVFFERRRPHEMRPMR